MPAKAQETALAQNFVLCRAVYNSFVLWRGVGDAANGGDTLGFPCFKSEGYDSLTCPQDGFEVHAQAVYLSKIGTVKAILHRAGASKLRHGLKTHV